jgi:hypothetical protein
VEDSCKVRVDTQKQEEGSHLGVAYKQNKQNKQTNKKKQKKFLGSLQDVKVFAVKVHHHTFQQSRSKLGNLYTEPSVPRHEVHPLP